MTKFWRILCLARKWRQKCSVLATNHIARMCSAWMTHGQSHASSTNWRRKNGRRRGERYCYLFCRRKRLNDSVHFILSWCDITLKSMSKNGNKTFFYRKKGNMVYINGNFKVEMQRLQRLNFFQMKFKIWWS